MDRKKDKWYYVTLVLCSISSALALTMRFVPAAESSYLDLKNGFGGTAFTATLLSGVLIWCNGQIDRIKKDKLHRKAVCFIIALIWLMGESFMLDDTLSALCSSPVQCFKSAIYAVGNTYLLIQLTYLFAFFLNTWGIERKDLPVWENRLVKQYRKHPFACPLAVFLLGLFPQLISSYPARMYYDTEHQLMEYFGFYPFSAHHPPASTWLMGKVVSVGLRLGNGNWGLFLYITLQYLLLAFLSAYLVYTVRNCFLAPGWLQLTVMLLTLFAPYHAAYVGMMVKDVVYAYAVMLMEIEVLYLLHSDFRSLASKRHFLLFWLAAGLSVLLRNNGRYVVYPTLFTLLIVLAVKKWRRQKSCVVRYLLLFMAVVLSTTAAFHYLDHRYNIEKGSVREALSLPFQQTARYVKEHGEDVTEEEKEAISRVLDYESLEALYDPEISDPVKGTYHDDASAKDLQAYFGVWLRQFFRHPSSYVKATLNQNYVLFCPRAEIYAYGMDEEDINSEQSKRLAYNLGLYEVQSPVVRLLSKLQELYVRTALQLPVLGMTANMAVYDLVLLFLFLSAARKRMYRTILAMLPLLLSLLIVIAAPCVLPRYMFPVMYPLPAVLAFYLYEEKEKRENEGRIDKTTAENLL